MNWSLPSNTKKHQQLAIDLLALQLPRGGGFDIQCFVGAGLGGGGDGLGVFP